MDLLRLKYGSVQRVCEEEALAASKTASCRHKWPIRLQEPKREQLRGVVTKSGEGKDGEYGDEQGRSAMREGRGGRKSLCSGARSVFLLSTQ